jgi:hypothetical protein
VRNHHARHAEDEDFRPPIHLILVIAVVIVAGVVTLFQLAPLRGRTAVDAGWQPGRGPTAGPDDPAPPSSASPSPSSPVASRTPAARPRSPSSSPSRSTTPPAATFTAQFARLNEWRGGYNASVSVRNTGTVAGNWTVELRLPRDTRVTTAWPLASGGNTSWRQTGDTVRFTGRASARASAAFGYQANRPDDERSEIVSCTINGVRC